MADDSPNETKLASIVRSFKEQTIPGSAWFPAAVRNALDSGSFDDDSKREAAIILSKMLLDDSLKGEATFSLLRLGDSAVDCIISSGIIEMRHNSLAIISQIGTTKAVDALILLVNSGNYIGISEDALISARFKSFEDQSRAIDCLFIRVYNLGSISAIRALGNFNYSAIQNPFQKNLLLETAAVALIYLIDKKPEAITEIGKLYSQIENQKTLDSILVELARALHNPNAVIVISGINLLSEIGETRALPQFRRLLQDKNPLIQSCASKALGKLGTIGDIYPLSKKGADEAVNLIISRLADSICPEERAKAIQTAQVFKKHPFWYWRARGRALKEIHSLPKANLQIGVVR